MFVTHRGLAGHHPVGPQSLLGGNERPGLLLGVQREQEVSDAGLGAGHAAALAFVEQVFLLASGDEEADVLVSGFALGAGWLAAAVADSGACGDRHAANLQV